MTRDQVSRTLMLMERLRMDAGEADTVREERRLMREYSDLWKSIQPFVEGTEPYSDPMPPTRGCP